LARMRMSRTGPLCSFMVSSNSCVEAPKPHTRTYSHHAQAGSRGLPATWNILPAPPGTVKGRRGTTSKAARPGHHPLQR
jgi:hypothetical protein